MQWLLRHAIFYCLCVSACVQAAHAGDLLELDRIVVIKHESFGHTYQQAGPTLDYLPIDIQSRSFPKDVQSDFSMRGSGISGVLMLINGIRVNDPQTAHHNADIPLTGEDIQAVQVLPGAGSSYFGPDAIGGAVNIMIKRPCGNAAVIKATGGSHHSAGGLLSVSHAWPAAAARVTVARDVSGGFRFDTDSTKTTANGTATLELPSGTFDTFFGFTDKEFGAFDFYTPGLGFASREHTKTLLFEAGCDLDAQDLMIKPQIMWRRHYDTFILDRTQLKSSSLNRHRTDMYTPGVYLRRSLSYLGTVGAGVEFGGEHIVSTNLGNHTRNHASISLDESWGRSQTLIPSWSYRFDNFDSFGGMSTGSAALKKMFTQNISASLGIIKTGRIPSFTELFYSDPTTAGEPTLKPEEALAFQLGGGYAHAPWSFGSAVFFRKENNMIDWVKHAASQTRWRAENIGRSDVRGIESYLRFDSAKAISMEANYTYIGKDLHEQGLLYKYGRNFATHLANAVVAIHLPFGTQTFGFTYKKKPGRGGWPILTAGLTHGIGGAGEIFCTVENLFDKEHQEIPGVEQAGRWVQTGLKFEW